MKEYPSPCPRCRPRTVLSALNSHSHLVQIANEGRATIKPMVQGKKLRQTEVTPWVKDGFQTSTSSPCLPAGRGRAVLLLGAPHSTPGPLLPGEGSPEGSPPGSSHLAARSCPARRRHLRKSPQVCKEAQEGVLPLGSPHPGSSRTSSSKRTQERRQQRHNSPPHPPPRLIFPQKGFVLTNYRIV